MGNVVNQKYKIGFQMNPIGELNLKTDTTIRIVENYFKNGNDVFLFQPNDVFLEENQIFAFVRKVIFVKSNANLEIFDIILADEIKIELKDMDIIWIRQDPPFDMNYITSTFLLEKIENDVLILNNPSAIRNSPEKIMVTNFSELMPKTLITKNSNSIDDFCNKNGVCVIKPLYSKAGDSVFILDKNDKNYKSILEYFLNKYQEQVVVQKLIENVSLGDKRIMLLDGEILGVVNRVPKKNSVISNLAFGGIAEKCELSEKDIIICEKIKYKLKELGLFFVGIDVIDGMITEINVTSPTGIVSYFNLTKENKVIDIVDATYKKLEEFRKK